MKFFSLAILASLLASETLALQVLQALGCTRNTGTHCGKSTVVIPTSRLHFRISCPNAITATSLGVPDAFRAIALEGWLLMLVTRFAGLAISIPCQDAEWSLNRVLTGCTDNLGWDSQESRGAWFGFANENESPCGFVWTGRGTS